MIRAQSSPLKIPNQKCVFGCLLVLTITISVYYAVLSQFYYISLTLVPRNVTYNNSLVHRAIGFASSLMKHGLAANKANVNGFDYENKSNTSAFKTLIHEKLKGNVSINISDIQMPVNTVGGNQRCKQTFEKRFIGCPGPIGRLGNMMFQMAGAVGIAQTLKYTPAISKNNPMVQYFNLTTVKVFPKPLNATLKVHEGEWMKGNWTGKHPDYLCYNLTVSGYYQNWKVFNSTPEAIRDVFSIKPEHLNKAKSFLASNVPESRTVIGFHVRRGDYLLPYKQERGRVVADKNYTVKAMNFYRQRYKNAHFVVCSDDMKWCKENIQGPDVTFSNFTQPIVDLGIMSLCHHMIITGGTFGWWGAWLSGGTVVYLNDFPRPGSPLDKGDFRKKYYPSQWIGMSNGE